MSNGVLFRRKFFCTTYRVRRYKAYNIHPPLVTPNAVYRTKKLMRPKLEISFNAAFKWALSDDSAVFYYQSFYFERQNDGVSPFLANVNSRSRSLFAVARPSVCLSVVCRL